MSKELLKRNTKKSKSISLIIASCLIFILTSLIIATNVAQSSKKYNEAMKFYEEGKFEKSIEIFESLNSFKDSNEMLLISRYDYATMYYNTGKYDIAIQLFKELDDFKDSDEMVKKCIYYKGKKLAEGKKWDKAIDIMITIPGFYDSDEMILKYTYNKALDKADNREFESAIEILNTVLEYNDSQELINECTYKLAGEKANDKYWDTSIEILSSIPNYKDSNELINQYNINKVLNIEPMYPFDVAIIENPTSVDDFEKLYLYMARYNTLSYNISYDIPLDRGMLNRIYDNSYSAFENLYYKYPEYFSYFSNIRCENYPVESDILNLEFICDEFGYNRVIEMISEFREESYNIVNNLIDLGKITSNMSEKEKAKVLYIWMAHNMAYDEKLSKESYNGYGAAILRKPSCVGYTALYNMLCRIVGIDVEGVTGIADGERHRWTIANLDDERLFIDTTWGDPVPDTKNYCDLSYFAVTKGFLSKTHKWDN